MVSGRPVEKDHIEQKDAEPPDKIQKDKAKIVDIKDEQTEEQTVTGAPSENKAPTLEEKLEEEARTIRDCEEQLSKPMIQPMVKKPSKFVAHTVKTRSKVADPPLEVTPKVGYSDVEKMMYIQILSFIIGILFFIGISMPGILAIILYSFGCWFLLSTSTMVSEKTHFFKKKISEIPIGFANGIYRFYGKSVPETASQVPPQSSVKKLKIIPITDTTEKTKEQMRLAKKDLHFHKGFIEVVPERNNAHKATHYNFKIEVHVNKVETVPTGRGRY